MTALNVSYPESILPRLRYQYCPLCTTPLVRGVINDDGLTATQIARRLRVTSATASDYLRWLCEVDLIQVKDHLYSFRDPVLRFWVGNIVKGIELSLTAEPMDLKALIARLDTQFQRVSEAWDQCRKAWCVN